MAHSSHCPGGIRCAGTTGDSWESQGTAPVCLESLSLYPTPVLLSLKTFASDILPSPGHISELLLSSAESVALYHLSSLITLIIDIVLYKSSRIPTLASKASLVCNICALKIDTIIDLCKTWVYFSTFLCFHVVSGYETYFRKNTSDYSFKIIKLFLI